MKKETKLEQSATDEEIRLECEKWARFLYKLYKERKDIARIVLEE
jgi:hypothetical protein